MKIFKNNYQNFLDKHLSKRLLKNIQQAQSDKNVIYLFSSRRKLASKISSRFHAKLYILVALELMKRGYGSYLLFNDYLIEPYFPILNINGIRFSNSIYEDEPKIFYSSDSIIPSNFTPEIDLEKKRNID